MPGSASAAASSADPPRRSSVAATPASADAVASAGAFLALVDVLLRLGRERIGIELHVRLREIALLPRLRRIEARAPAAREGKRDQDEDVSPAHRIRPFVNGPRANRGCGSRRQP